MKKIIVAVLLMLVMAVCVLAAPTVTYSIEDTTVADTYKIVATMSDTEGEFIMFCNSVTFDSEVILPVHRTKGTVVDVLNAAGTNSVKYPLDVYQFEDEFGDTVKANYPADPIWTGNGSKISLEYDTYLTPADCPANGYVMFSMYFKYADGKTVEDIKADTFVVDSVTYTNDRNSELDNYYGRDDEGYTTNMTVVNNVVPAAPVVVEYWNVGNGYNLHDMDGNKVADNSPITKSGETETAVTVKYGGYYKDTANWSGAALKEAVTVDGLEIEVTYTELPSSTDCWAYIGVLADPSIFSTKNDAYNNGYVNLIRYYNDNIGVMGTTSWTTVGTYGAGEGFFAIEAGDVLRVCFDKNAEGTYDITYVKNGAETFKLPVALDLEEALGGTIGYPVVSASCKGSEEGAFEYTVDVAPEELAVAKIPVAAGDTVYEYTEDGSSYTLTKVTANGTYDIILTNNDYISVIVNSGYTSQKAYSVSKVFADGYFMEVENVANGVLGDDEVSVRVVDPQGIRFFGTVKNVIAELDNFDEYGFIMTVESAYNNLGTDYVLDMALVEAGKAKKGVAKDATTDKYFSRDSEATVIAGVLYGIPKTAEGVQTVIVSRPYYKLGDAYVYGEETKATLYDIAKAIYNVEGYEVAWEYAKEVIELVEGDIDTPVLPELDNEIAIDVSELYK